MILAILAALIALTVRIAAAEPISDELGAAIDELESGELDDREIDELIAEAVDELTDDQLEELGIDDTAIDRGWAIGAPAETARSRSPIGWVDLALVYRHTDPIASERRDELLLVGTWRR